MSAQAGRINGFNSSIANIPRKVSNLFSRTFLKGLAYLIHHYCFVVVRRLAVGRTWSRHQLEHKQWEWLSHRASLWQHCFPSFWSISLCEKLHQKHSLCEEMFESFTEILFDVNLYAQSGSGIVHGLTGYWLLTESLQVTRGPCEMICLSKQKTRKTSRSSWHSYLFYNSIAFSFYSYWMHYPNVSLVAIVT